MEEYTKGKDGHNSSSTPAKWIGIVLIVAIVGIGGFLGGISYQKGHQKTVSSSVFGSRAGAGLGGPRGGQMGGFGTVASISASSISVKNSQSGSTTTYTITSSTTITNNGSAATTSDIQTGDTVIVQPIGSGSTTASQIIVNPSMPSGGPNGPGSGSTGSSTMTN